MKDYQAAWEVLQAMPEDAVKARRLEYELAHSAQTVGKKDISIKYYKLYLKGLSSEEVNDEVVGNVAHNGMYSIPCVLLLLLSR